MSCAVIAVLRRGLHKSGMAQFQPVVLSGPSGSGKSTLLKRLMDEFKGCFAFSISREPFFSFLSIFEGSSLRALLQGNSW